MDLITDNPMFIVSVLVILALWAFGAWRLKIANEAREQQQAAARRRRLDEAEHGEMPTVTTRAAVDPRRQIQRDPRRAILEDGGRAVQRRVQRRPLERSVLETEATNTGRFGGPGQRSGPGSTMVLPDLSGVRRLQQEATRNWEPPLVPSAELLVPLVAPSSLESPEVERLRTLLANERAAREAADQEKLQAFRDLAELRTRPLVAAVDDSGPLTRDELAEAVGLDPEGAEITGLVLDVIRWSLLRAETRHGATRYSNPDTRIAETAEAPGRLDPDEVKAMGEGLTEWIAKVT